MNAQHKIFAKSIRSIGKELSYGYSKKVHTVPIYPSPTSIEAPERGKFLLY